MDIDNLLKGFFLYWIGIIIQVYILPTSWIIAWFELVGGVCVSIATIKKLYGESRSGNEECIGFVLLSILFFLIVLRRAIKLSAFHLYGVL